MRTWLFVPLAALCIAPAYASGPEGGQFAFSLLGGVDLPSSGDVHTGAVAGVPYLGPLTPALAWMWAC